MAPKRKTHSEEFKARVAMEAIKEVRTLSELSASHGVHPTVIAHGKQQLVEGAPEVFRRGLAGTGRSEEVVTAPLYRRSAASRWTGVAQKKALSVPRETRCGWIHADPGALSIVHQCEVAGLARSTYSYEPVPERAENLALMRLIDELYLQRPFYGVRRMTDWLPTVGHVVNHKRVVARLMRVRRARTPRPPGGRTSFCRPGAGRRPLG